MNDRVADWQGLSEYDDLRIREVVGKVKLRVEAGEDLYTVCEEVEIEPALYRKYQARPPGPEGDSPPDGSTGQTSLITS